MSGSDRAWRVGVPACGMAAVALFAVLYRELPGAYFGLLTIWGLDPFRFPFLDMHAVLSALQCARQGIDTYQYNPCDAMTRAFVYSPLILDAAAIPVSVTWNDWAGGAVALLFFVGVASLPPPRGRREWLIMALAICSTMSAFAVERGNIDIAIFAMMILAVHLLRGRPGARAAGYAVIAFAASIKFYPAVALVAALRERPRRFLSVAVIAAAVATAFIVLYRHALAEAMARVPTGSYYTDFFWAGNLPLGLTHLLGPLTAIWPSAAAMLRLLPSLLGVALLFSCGQSAVRTMRWAETMPRLPESHLSFFVLGAAVIVGCFFAGQSIGYRGIFFLMLLPGLLLLGRETAAGAPFRVTAALILFLMWGEMFRQGLQHLTPRDPALIVPWQTAKTAFWLLRELIWWRAIGTLAGLLLCSTREFRTVIWAIGGFGIAQRAPR